MAIVWLDELRRQCAESVTDGKPEKSTEEESRLCAQQCRRADILPSGPSVSTRRVIDSNDPPTMTPEVYELRLARPRQNFTYACSPQGDILLCIQLLKFEEAE